jgi:pilus assembly protein Flp/PilA
LAVMRTSPQALTSPEGSVAIVGTDMTARHMKRFIRDERGATSIEYALIAAFIFLVIIVSVTSVGESLVPIFQRVAAGLAL